MNIIPSILVKTREDLIEKVKQLEGKFERAHLDIADGIFVPNTTIDTLGDLETSLEFNAHLMVSKPENHIVKWIDSVASITFHVEATQKHQEVIDAIRYTFDYFMSEKYSSYRPHYNSIMNGQFKKMGFGMVLPEGDGYYFAVHYGTAVDSTVVFCDE